MYVKLLFQVKTVYDTETANLKIHMKNVSRLHACTTPCITM